MSTQIVYDRSRACLRCEANNQLDIIDVNHNDFICKLTKITQLFTKIE